MKKRSRRSKVFELRADVLFFVYFNSSCAQFSNLLNFFLMNFIKLKINKEQKINNNINNNKNNNMR